MARLLFLLALLIGGAVHANGFRLLEGHGGPVMGVATGDKTAATASFDNSVGLWPLSGGEPVWLDGHEAAVKSVIFVGDDLLASAGDDQMILIWNRATGSEIARITSHTGKIMSLASSPDGSMIASASWDRRIGLWEARTGKLIRWLDGHTGNVNDVAFSGNASLFSASYDGTVREWRLADGTQTRILARHGFGVNTLLLNAAADWLAYGALDGGTRAIRLSDGSTLADLSLDRRPILSMAQRADGGQIAVGDGEGYIMVVETENWTVTHDFHAAKRGPIWALSYVDDGTGLLAGGIEDSAYIWPIGLDDSPQMAETRRTFHTDPSQVGNGERQFLRKCSICHSLTPESGRKAGPTLYGLFGRPAGTVDGYSYSDALTGTDIVWGPESIDKLFDLGPDHYTPGSKMPMQRITGAKDRTDLIEFLRLATRTQ